MSSARRTRLIFVSGSIYTRKWSAVSLCSGILAGLVAITPAAGYVGTPASLAIGFLGAVGANYATGIKVLLRIDDAVDGFALHAVGGFIGALLTGIFADSRVVGFDGYSEAAGWINHHYVQLGWQLASACTVIAYTAVVTYILLFIVDHIPGCRLRCHEDSEIVGMDESECGEVSYDYVSLRRDVEDTIASEHPHSVGISRQTSGSLDEKKHGVLPQSEVTTTSARESGPIAAHDPTREA